MRSAVGGLVTVAAANACSSPDGEGSPAASQTRSSARPDRPLHYQDLWEVSERIAAGEIDSVSATESLLARIEALEPRLHSYITVTGERALERAAAADALREGGEVLGPLHSLVEQLL